MQCDQTKCFTCNTGDCIDIDRRCDEISDCEDESDELNDLCQIAYINTKTYVKSNVPLPSGDEVNSMHLNVVVGFTLSEIDDIDTKKLEFKLAFQVTLKWHEYRILHYNTST